MKLNPIFISLLFSITITLNSCSRYLDTEPISDRATNPETPIEDAQQAEDIMTSIYSFFGNEYWQLDYFFNGDAQTDISYAGADNVQNFQQDEYQILATNTNVNRDWNYLSDVINNCNKIINYVDQVADPALTTARKNEMKSEASIFRALYLFHMTQLWGDVPIVTKTFIDINAGNFDEAYEQLFPVRKPVNEVYTQIITDLEGAIANAPDSSEKFRANKGAAFALLAKVYATKPNPDWTKVKEYCDMVSSQGYTLLSDYDQLFDGTHE